MKRWLAIITLTLTNMYVGVEYARINHDLDEQVANNLACKAEVNHSNDMYLDMYRKASDINSRLEACELMNSESKDVQKYKAALDAAKNLKTELFDTKLACLANVVRDKKAAASK